jgi:hypothetical protein
VNRKETSKILGTRVIAPLIKNKGHRKKMTDFIDELRTSKTFRDRQMYVIIANATFKADSDIFKKHFAKAMGNEMINEKVAVVRILMAKLIGKVPRGFSKSADKLFEALVKQCKNGELGQFLIQAPKQSVE